MKSEPLTTSHHGRVKWTQQLWIEERQTWIQNQQCSWGCPTVFNYISTIPWYQWQDVSLFNFPLNSFTVAVRENLLQWKLLVFHATILMSMPSFRHSPNRYIWPIDGIPTSIIFWGWVMSIMRWLDAYQSCKTRTSPAWIPCRKCMYQALITGKKKHDKSK